MATELVKGIKVDSKPQALFTGDPFEIDTSFADLCEPINCKGAKSVLLWIDLDINTSTSVEIKVIVGTEEDNCEYSIPIESVSTSIVDLDSESIKLPNSDTKMVREFILSESIPYLKFQVKDAADGTGQIESAKVTFKV